MRAIIVDDEIKSRKLMHTAIEQYTTGIEIVGEAHSVESAVKVILETNPQVLFLDIQLGDGTGFDILEQLAPKKYKVVFVTAYDNYAIRAIKFSAIDYLVKPLDLEDLKSAILRLKSMHEVSHENVSVAQEHMNDATPNRLMISTSNGYISVEVKEIIAIVSYGNYVFVHTADNKYIATNTIQHYEELLPDVHFARIHRSHIVNIQKVTSIDKKRSGSVTLSNGMQLDLAARRKTTFLKQYKSQFEN